METSYQTLLENTIDTILSNNRNGIQSILITVFESLMKAERDFFLSAPDATNKGNGYYQRFVNHFQGRYEIRVPRDRQGLFVPLTLEVIRQDAKRMNDLALSLYSHGISQRGIKQVFKDVLGSRMSPGKLCGLIKALEPYRQSWQQQSLESFYPMIMIDALKLSVKRKTVAKESVYIVMGLTQDFRREILGLYLLPEETSYGWKTVFDDLNQRGLKQTGLVISDELSGIDHAVSHYFPGAHHQLCLIHKLRNLLTRVRAKEKETLVADFHRVFDLNNGADTVENCLQRLQSFINHWTSRYPSFKNQLPECKWHNYCAYLNYPPQVRKMLYTTNWIERLNKEIRKVSKHVNSFPNPDSVLNMIFMVITRLESTTYSKPVTSFYPYKEHMNNVFQPGQTQSY